MLRLKLNHVSKQGPWKQCDYHTVWFPWHLRSMLSWLKLDPNCSLWKLQSADGTNPLHEPMLTYHQWGPIISHKILKISFLDTSLDIINQISKPYFSGVIELYNNYIWISCALDAFSHFLQSRYGPNNERHHNIVTMSLIGWVHTETDPCSYEVYFIQSLRKGILKAFLCYMQYQFMWDHYLWRVYNIGYIISASLNHSLHISFHYQGEYLVTITSTIKLLSLLAHWSFNWINCNLH